MKRFFQIYWPEFLLVLFGMGVHAYFAALGPLNFTSDQAIMGIDAMRLLEGTWSWYQSGQNYNGNLYALLATPCIALFGGGNVFVLKIAFILMTGLFFILQYRLVLLLWDRRIALLWLLLITLPHYAIVRWGYFMHFNTFSTLAMGTLLCFTYVYRKQAQTSLLIGIGVVSAIAKWYNPAFILFIILLVGLAVFSSDEWNVLRTTARWACDYKRRAMQILLLGIGYYIGSVPVLLDPRSTELHSDFQVPRIEQWRDLFNEILPAIWGPVHLSVLIGAIVCIGLIAHRKKVGEIFLLYRQTEQHRKISIFLGIFILFFVAILFRHPRQLGQARFILMMWPALCVLIAVGLSVLWDKSRAIGIVVLAIVVGFHLHYHLEELRQISHQTNPHFSQSTIRDIKVMHVNHNVSHGLADYWIAFALDFFYYNDIALASYMGSNRYPEFYEQAMQEHRYSLILKHWTIKGDVERTPTALIEWFLANERKRGNHREAIEEKVRRSRIVEHKHIGRFHVFILEDPALP